MRTKELILLIFTSRKAMSVDEPGIQGLVRLGQKVVQVVWRSRAPREPTARQAEKRGELGRGEGGGDRWSTMVPMEGGRQHWMEARGKAC